LRSIGFGCKAMRDPPCGLHIAQQVPKFVLTPRKHQRCHSPTLLRPPPTTALAEARVACKHGLAVAHVEVRAVTQRRVGVRPDDGLKVCAEAWLRLGVIVTRGAACGESGMSADGVKRRCVVTLCGSVSSQRFNAGDIPPDAEDAFWPSRARAMRAARRRG
jgi:hypothetical protein